MSDLHDLCKFEKRPIDSSYVEQLRYYLKNGIPATYTVEEAYAYTNNIEEEPSTTTTPLHLICTHLPAKCEKSELEIVEKMVEILLEYGAGWCFVDINNETPGCILIRRNLTGNNIYKQIVQAGVRAELLLRKISESEMEIIEDTDGLDHQAFETLAEESIPELVTDNRVEDEIEAEDKNQLKENIDQPPANPDSGKVSGNENDKNTEFEDAAGNQDIYLKTKLEYVDDALVTKDSKDGVMMAWETDLMQLGCNSMFKDVDKKEDKQINILNIGFGMGIIDTMINSKNPTKHYICEAHPDVIAKLHRDGWYEKPNVVILEGTWKEQLDILLSKGSVFFDGIYYDTFSETYEDMLELFEYIVGLLKADGVFSFFNGLGADRQVVYEVYKQLVEIDLANYGLQCTFTDIPVPEATLKTKNDDNDVSVWEGIKRPYWTCPVYYHPEVRFMDI